MPLNPNGKIDKPALPFPDTAQAAVAEPSKTGPSASPTEEAMRSIWSRVLTNPPSPIPLDESFFDLGGHSILATRLIFEVRKTFLVNAPLGLIFDKPTIGSLSAAIDGMRNSDLGIAGTNGDQTPVTSSTVTSPTMLSAALKRGVQARKLEYGQDFEQLVSRLRHSYPSPVEDYGNRPLTVFLTGATGFLGAFVLHDLLSRRERVKKVICLVRASETSKALARLQEAVAGRGVWDEEWISSSRLEVVKGDLDQDHFGLDDATWNRVADEADAIIHNGALVRPLSFSYMAMLGYLTSS